MNSGQENTNALTAKQRLINFIDGVIPDNIQLKHISMTFEENGDAIIRLSNNSRKAQWVKSDIPGEEYRCSKCGGACWYYDFTHDVKKSRFCPNCGAEMEEDDDEIIL